MASDEVSGMRTICAVLDRSNDRFSFPVHLKPRWGNSRLAFERAREVRGITFDVGTDNESPGADTISAVAGYRTLVVDYSDGFVFDTVQWGRSWGSCSGFKNVRASDGSTTATEPIFKADAYRAR